MAKFDKLINNKVAQNIFIWLCLFIILYGAIQADNKVLSTFYSLAVLASSIYITNLVILPYLKKNKSLFFLFFVINAACFSIIIVFFISDAIKEFFSWEAFFIFFGIMTLAMTFGIATKIARNSFEQRQQKREAELMLLKSQLNPHFLFNTLNNLYGLSVIKSDKLPDLMLKLSELLRYSLYDTKETLAPLEKEVQYLENYISLEKIRLENQTKVLFHKSGNITTTKILPMLLIVFVENAFKHLGMTANNENAVTIDLKVEEGKLLFKCKNTIDDTALKVKNLTQDIRSGIGLENARKRLQLMYPDKHQLIIKKENQNYIVELSIFFL